MSKTAIEASIVDRVVNALSFTATENCPGHFRAETVGVRIEKDRDGSLRFWHDASGSMVALRPGARGAAWRVRNVCTATGARFTTVWPSDTYTREANQADGTRYAPSEAQDYATRFLKRLAVRMNIPCRVEA